MPRVTTGCFPASHNFVSVLTSDHGNDLSLSERGIIVLNVFTLLTFGKITHEHQIYLS